MRKRISKYKHLHSNRFRYLSSSIPLVCTSGLLLVCGIMISPISSIRQLGISGDAYADITVSGGGNTGTTTTPASVSMVFDKDTVTNEQVDVVAGTPVASEAKYFTITPSGSVEKYSIYVQTSSSNNGSLVASNTNNNATIATLPDKTTGVPLSSLSTNTWGYALSTGKQATSSMLYKGLSGSTNAISAYDSTTNPTAAQDFTLAFAANIGTDKPADHYVANVLVSVAANPGEVTSGFGGIEYMDELTSTICKNAKENETAQLTDWRDRKSYWVTKLKDGNCWMTQNLDYDDPASTKVSTPSSWPSGGDSYRGYYDPGNYYYATPSNWTTCNNSIGLSACTNNGWSSAGDNHYHAGNYYSWATVISSSICPSGWQLPISNRTTDSGSFGSLAIVYGVGSNAAGATTLRNSPLYFIPGGYVEQGSIAYAGNQGFYWSSTGLSNGNSYILHFSSSSVGPSAEYGRSPYGRSVRCLVQGS